jgi:hypothetical protein
MRDPEANMAIKLYDLAGAETDRRFSPYCWRARMALVHKGLPDLLAIIPNGLVHEHTVVVGIQPEQAGGQRLA